MSAIAYRSDATIAADEFCSAILVRRIVGTENSTLIGKFLGLDLLDVKWIAPDGRDCTVLCDRSDMGGFDSQAWTIDGWALSDQSMAELRAEFPDQFANR